MKAKASMAGMDVGCAGQLSMMEVYHESESFQSRGGRGLCRTVEYDGGLL